VAGVIPAGRAAKPEAAAQVAASTEELVLLARGGDAWALGELVKAYHPQVFAYLVRLSGDRETAKDLAQEVFLRCCTSLGSLRDPAGFRPWVFRTAYNLFLDERKRWQRRIGATASEAGSARDPGRFAAGDRTPGGPAEGPARSHQVGADEVEQALLRLEQADRVRDALLCLAPRHRNAVVLRFYHQLSIEEIARATGAPAGTVKSRLHYAIARLRATLEESSR
jgi:RNA polymerase sigma-70 factor (ECF subfamily)